MKECSNHSFLEISSTNTFQSKFKKKRNTKNTLQKFDFVFLLWTKIDFNLYYILLQKKWHRKYFILFDFENKYIYKSKTCYCFLFRIFCWLRFFFYLEHFFDFDIFPSRIFLCLYTGGTLRETPLWTYYNIYMNCFKYQHIYTNTVKQKWNPYDIYKFENITHFRY